ncbi:hypothetical protein GCM10017673_14990 [Streptosporangium violaceochromogenes]|nr:hypothetical protein GCM10017673_14990 [Streptosporangium violaceochromogenes]
MNGLELPQPPRPIAELRAELALAEACEPIWQAHQDAKAAYAEALESGDLAAIRAAGRAKNAAAIRLNETRAWLRREARIARLTAEIPNVENRLAGPVVDRQGRESAELRAELEELLAAMRAELEELSELAAPLRELFGAQPGPDLPVVVEDGSASADGVPVTVRARARTGKGA